MRSYECAVILHPAVNEDGLKASTAKYVDIIAGRGGEITRVETWGKRRLSHEIMRQLEGHYYFYRFRGDSAIIGELGRQMRIDEGILRHMIVRDELAEGTEAAMDPRAVEVSLRQPEPEEHRPSFRDRDHRDRDDRDHHERRGHRDREEGHRG